MASEFKEMNINLTNVDDVAYITVFQNKYKRQIEQLAESFPGDVEILAKNDNGTLYARMDKRFVHVSFGHREKREGRKMTEEERAASVERLRKAREAKMKEKMLNEQ